MRGKVFVPFPVGRLSLSLVANFMVCILAYESFFYIMQRPAKQ